jgi:F-box interacting protein
VLPYDLIFEILLRVPVRSACRFRCVSKRWYALISDQTFLAAHKSLHNVSLIVGTSSSRLSWKNPYPRHDLQLMDMDGNVVRVIKGVSGTGLPSSSSDDLVCILNDHYIGFRVIDPLTGKVLQESPTKPVGQHVETHYYESHLGFGFGRAVPSGVYKVVRFKSNLTCKVFSVGDDTAWRESPLPATHIGYHMENHPVVVDGIMYFLVVTQRADDHYLLCFDLESEEWIKTIDTPCKVADPVFWEKGIGRVSIVELNDALCMVQPEVHMTDNNCTNTNIWLLADFDKKIWFKAYTIPRPLNTYHFMPLRMVGDSGKLIFYCSFRGEGHAIQVYDPDTGRCTILRQLQDMSDRVSVCIMHLDRFVSANT